MDNDCKAKITKNFICKYKNVKKKKLFFFLVKTCQKKSNFLSSKQLWTSFSFFTIINLSFSTLFLCFYSNFYSNLVIFSVRKQKVLFYSFFVFDKRNKGHFFCFIQITFHLCLSNFILIFCRFFLINLTLLGHLIILSLITFHFFLFYNFFYSNFILRLLL